MYQNIEFCAFAITGKVMYRHMNHCRNRGEIGITKTRPCNILQFFTPVKNDNFQMKNCDVFLIFAQNIDCGYTLEPPQ